MTIRGTETGIPEGAIRFAVSKLIAAHRLLSDSGLPAKRIAQRCGFGSEQTLRRSFLRLLAVPPHDYRMRFRA